MKFVTGKKLRNLPLKIVQKESKTNIPNVTPVGVCLRRYPYIIGTGIREKRGRTR